MPSTRAVGRRLSMGTPESTPSCTVIVIGGLKSTGLTKTCNVCTIKIFPVEILTIPHLSMLRDDQKSLAAYVNYRLALFGTFHSFRPARS
jgi:hypothetical protein